MRKKHDSPICQRGGHSNPRWKKKEKLLCKLLYRRGLGKKRCLILGGGTHLTREKGLLIHEALHWVGRGEKKRTKVLRVQEV